MCAFITIIARTAGTESVSVPSVLPLALWRGDGEEREERRGEERRGEERRGEERRGEERRGEERRGEEEKQEGREKEEEGRSQSSLLVTSDPHL